jgi:Loader and inhibitor of phage G40P.
MSETETLVIFTLLSTAYPYAYKEISDEQMDATIALWQDMFADTPAEKVKIAIKAHVANNKFAPTIAEIKDYIEKMSEPSLPSGIEAWQLVRKAMTRGEYMMGGYDYTKAFNALPALVQRVVGDPMQLRIWGMTELDQLEGFDRQRFITNYDKQARAQAEFGRLPGMIQAQIAKSLDAKSAPIYGLIAEAQRRVKENE